MVSELLTLMKERLDAKKWNPEGNYVEFSVFVQSKKYAYCSDAIKLVEKTFKPLGCKCKLEHYSVIANYEGSRYNYTFRLKKDKDDYSELPF